MTAIIDTSARQSLQRNGKRPTARRGLPHHRRASPTRPLNRHGAARIARFPEALVFPMLTCLNVAPRLPEEKKVGNARYRSSGNILCRARWRLSSARRSNAVRVKRDAFERF